MALPLSPLQLLWSSLGLISMQAFCPSLFTGQFQVVVVPGQTLVEAGNIIQMISQKIHNTPGTAGLPEDILGSGGGLQ